MTFRPLREDPGATLAEFYRRHAPSLHRFALRLCGAPAAAEDLVAEAFALEVAGRGPLEPPLGEGLPLRRRA